MTTLRDTYGHLPRLKILINTPSINAVNGGIYVLLQWCNKLKEIFGHDVTLFTENKLEKSSTWRKLNVPITSEFKGGYYDAVIIGSPHSIWIEDFITTEKCFIFAQMAEHLFHPDDQRWVSKCLKFYRSSHPMFSISTWNIMEFQRLGRKGVTYYITNGMDFNDFPIERLEKDGKTILLESPESKNPTKDSDHLALRLAGELKQRGYKVIGYGARPLSHLRQNVDHYKMNPTLKQINEMYREASVMIKATKCDASSLSPWEAFTKGCSVSRFVDNGDDQLINEYNCLKTNYEYEKLKEQTFRLLEDQELRAKLVHNAYEFISKQTWENALYEVNEIITA